MGLIKCEGGFNLKLLCDVILDLMPIVKDRVASEESCRIVNEHIEQCENCKTIFESMSTDVAQISDIRDKKIISAIKRSIFTTQLVLIISGSILGILLTHSRGMLYNFLLMPLLGVLGYCVFKFKWYIVPVGVFALSYLWQIVLAVYDGYFEGLLLFGNLYLSFIYSLLVLLGTAIAFLLKYAFGKER